VREPVTLEGAVVRLEPLALAHADALASITAADPELYQWTTAPAGVDAAKEYIHEALDWLAASTALPFVIVRRGDGEIVGTTRFANIEWWPWPEGHEHHGRTTPDAAEIGWTFLAREATRTGVNTDAKTLLLTHAFDTWHMHRVWLRTDVRNERSRNAIARIGGRFEGVRRADAPGADGIVRDSAIFSITADDWPEVRERLAALAQR
jgi:RimJ/RimL family protein N-acetyltransferase